MKVYLGVALALTCAIAAACGTSQDGGGPPAPSGGDEDASVFGTGSDAEAGALTLRIEPPTATVTVSGSLASPSGSVQLTAYSNASPSPVTAAWSVDNAALGTVSTSGLFTAATIAGKTTVLARVGAAQATAEITVNVKMEDDRVGLSAADKAALRAGGVSDPTFKWLYPYDKTVFPRGLTAPTLQLSGPAPRAFRLAIRSKLVDYEGFFPGGAGAARIAAQRDLWRMVTESAGAGDPVSVEVTKLEGASNVSGPVKETWSVAPGSLKGTVFYNSYNSKLAAAKVASAGAILRVKPGQPLEVLIGSARVGQTEQKCVVCHSVSANGTRLSAGLWWSDQAPDSSNPVDSGMFNIGTTGAASLRYADGEGRKLPFGAFTPDGKWLLGNAVAPSGYNPRGLSGDFPSRLYDADTGTVSSDGYFSGATPRHAVTPSFSPDGKWLAFSDADASDGHTLALLKFNGGTASPAFSGYVALATNSAKILGWPSFTPDLKAVLYQEGDHYDTGRHSATDTLGPFHADLKWVDLATRTVFPLHALNGVLPSGTTSYLPYGEAEDGHLNYEPTLLPAPVGGYAWVVFTSRRSLGNVIYDGPNSLRPVGDRAFDNGDQVGRGFRKKLWVAAIDLSGAPGTDISHPAFYLEDQEAEAGNMRGFWALDPCKGDGSTCETGDECCGGFCRQVTEADGALGKRCVPPPSGCANESEKCSNDGDCCAVGQGTRCVNGFCALPTPPR